jgi:glycosyltransferase involved in cell wall biosynthesis
MEAWRCGLVYERKTLVFGGPGQMIIRISNKYGTWDGAKTGKGYFAQRLICALQALGVEVITDPKPKADIDLQFGKHSYEPNARKNIVRMGPAHVGKDHREQNVKKRQALKHADAIIYQSEFGRKMCDAFLGTFKGGPAKVIFNGADQDIFNKGMKLDGPYLFIASTRAWTPQKRLNDIINAFRLADIPDAELGIIGDIEPAVLDGNIEIYGPRNQGFVARMLGRAHTLISIVWLDCMPNSACEAICAGCNVVTTSASGTPEIAPSLVLQETEWDFGPCDPMNPPKVDRNALAELMRKAIKAPAPDPWPVDINNIAKQYLAFFEEVLHG